MTTPKYCPRCSKTGESIGKNCIDRNSIGCPTPRPLPDDFLIIHDLTRDTTYGVSLKEIARRLLNLPGDHQYQLITEGPLEDAPAQEETPAGKPSKKTAGKPKS